ncbi:hypothetical protein [Chitinophaga japonensis]|uniref:hypothetical protein n=1 Tax=Chitinophaga japonensis TaxID=104662 RepID=UPI00119D779D|nr:hypothetical protein [Chitinophaga japonensis]
MIQQQMPRVTYYSFQFRGAQLTETEKFITRFKDHALYGQDFNMIMAVINEMGRNRGANVDYFRGERYGEALPPPYKSGNLRLYCGRYSGRIVILCNGGVKTSRLPENSPDCRPHFELMNALMKNINKRVWERTLSEKDGILTGDLNFEIGDCYD